MKSQCMLEVAKAIGRALTPAEAKDIDAGVLRAMRKIAAEDPQAWMGKSASERLQEAGERAGKELIADAQLKQRREALTVLAHARIDQHLTEMAGRGISGLDALNRMIAFHADGKSAGLAMETQAKAIFHDAIRQMLPTLEASHPKWFGLYENQKGIEAIIRELFGEHTGDADAKAGAQLFHEIAAKLRERFNRAGGDIGELDDWGLPHHHSQLLVAKSGKDAWVADVLPLLNRDRYVNEDGTRMSDVQLTEFLRQAWTTIATGGANKVEPGRFQGGGARSNRGSAHRQVHFKDADGYISYWKKYGERSLYEVLVGHINGISKDIALVETMGPNPDHSFRFYRDRLVSEGKIADPTKVGKFDEAAIKSESLYNEVSGKTQPVASELLAKSFDTLRNWLIASRLGSSIITSFSDEATLHLTARLNKMPEMQLVANELKAFNRLNKSEERMAMRAGLSLQTMISSLNRFGQNGLGQSFSRKLASTVLRASGLNAMTEARRRGFGVTMMGSIGGVVKEHGALKDISPSDHRILLSKGVTETDFKVWKAAQLENWGGGNDTMLTPDAIYRVTDADIAAIDPTIDPAQAREQAAMRLLGAVLEETDVAIIEPGAKERAMMGGGIQKGTWKGEITRSFFLFKSFPMAMLTRHVVRGMSMPNLGGRAQYLATLFGATTILGMLSLQVDQMLQGKDPRTMNMARKGGIRNWIAAMLKGGSLGIYGDFLFSDATQSGQSAFGAVSGPVAGMVEDTLNLSQGNMVQFFQGKPTNAGAELVRFVRGNTPGASLWYAKAALDHMIFHRLMEYFSPGYLNQIRMRAERDFGQRYWWEPGTTAPDRAPDIGAMVQ